MLRITKTEYQNKTFRLPVDLIEKLAEAAQKNNVSMTKLVIELCEYGLENLEESDSWISKDIMCWIIEILYIIHIFNRFLGFKNSYFELWKITFLNIVYLHFKKLFWKYRFSVLFEIYLFLPYPYFKRFFHIFFNHRRITDRKRCFGYFYTKHTFIFWFWFDLIWYTKYRMKIFRVAFFTVNATENDYIDYKLEKY